MASGVNPVFGMSGASGDPSMSTSSPQPTANPRKRRMIDQIMQSRMGAQQQMSMMMMGGPEYLDYIQQMQQNPMMTFY